MRELKRKEIIAGLIMLILLAIIAMILIIKREVGNRGGIHTEQIVADSQTDIGDDMNLEAVVTTDSEDSLTTDTTIQIYEDTASTAKNSNTQKTVAGYYFPATMKEYRENDEQMKELYAYWAEYKLEAVDDLIHLSRVRVLTNELKGTNQFYYYGDTNKNGQPEGNGLAIYEDNTYYCGEWKNGVRSGEGMWLKIYPDTTVTLNGVAGVTSHSYNGEFLNDYPNGKGQEHIDYDFKKMTAGDNIANVIGGFKDGYYDGDDLYIMTVSSATDSTDWEANARQGVFLPIEENAVPQDRTRVWKDMKQNVEDRFFWMTEAENQGFGIYDLKKK